MVIGQEVVLIFGALSVRQFVQGVAIEEHADCVLRARPDLHSLDPYCVVLANASPSSTSGRDASPVSVMTRKRALGDAFIATGQ